LDKKQKNANDLDSSDGVENSENDTTPPAAESESQPSYQSLWLLLEDTRKKADDYLDQLMRARADTENVRRRGERELDKVRKYALDSFMQEMVAVKDSLEMGLSAAQEPGADVVKLTEGMELTDQLLAAAMNKVGAQEIYPLSEPFNPEWHQAMSTQVSNDVPPNTVVLVFQKGYVLNDRLIRPARVVVSKAAS
jgi:molecular chaperone GrpE